MKPHALPGRRPRGRDNGVSKNCRIGGCQNASGPLRFEASLIPESCVNRLPESPHSVGTTHHFVEAWRQRAKPGRRQDEASKSEAEETTFQPSCLGMNPSAAKASTQEARNRRLREKLRINERKQSFARIFARKQPARRSKMTQTAVCAQICVLPAIAHNRMLERPSRQESTIRKEVMKAQVDLNTKLKSHIKSQKG